MFKWYISDTILNSMPLQTIQTE